MIWLAVALGATFVAWLVLTFWVWLVLQVADVEGDR